MPSVVNEKTHDLSRRVAIVTGASRGIGRAIAAHLGSLGARVAICGRDPKKLDAAAADLRSKGASVLASVCDVASEASVEAFIDKVKKEFDGQIDILVNNAGIYRTEPLRGHSLQSWNEVLNVNLTGAMLCCRAVLETMIDRKFGRIINISSISGRTGEIWASAYSASKFGMIGLTQSLALETAEHGITVNAVCPGWVSTEMTHSQLEDPEWCKLNSTKPEDSVSNACFAVPQNRFIEPEEVAAMVAFLASESARGITGQSMNICGGLSLH